MEASTLVGPIHQVPHLMHPSIVVLVHHRAASIHPTQLTVCIRPPHLSTATNQATLDHNPLSIRPIHLTSEEDLVVLAAMAMVWEAAPTVHQVTQVAHPTDQPQICTGLYMAPAVVHRLLVSQASDRELHASRYRQCGVQAQTHSIAT